tara:strand:- start:187 stop:321 length:135 start_codon:yes stop_codon:yes gene_type:complete
MYCPIENTKEKKLIVEELPPRRRTEDWMQDKGHILEIISVKIYG